MNEPDGKLTKLTGDVIAAVSAQVRHLVNVGLVEPDKLRLTIEARRAKAKELVEGGLSQRDVAQALGVSVGTVNNDLAFNNRTQIVQELNAADRAERTKQKQEARRKREEGLALKTPEGSYGVIYADPPWKFEVYSQDTGQGRTAEAHYSTKPVGEIATTIPVASFAADDCALLRRTSSNISGGSAELLRPRRADVRGNGFDLVAKLLASEREKRAHAGVFGEGEHRAVERQRKYGLALSERRIHFQEPLLEGMGRLVGGVSHRFFARLHGLFPPDGLNLSWLEQGNHPRIAKRCAISQK
jgi:hypothetical protein